MSAQKNSDHQTSRRSFIKTASAATLASAAPTILHAADKAGQKNPVLGKGEFKYEAIHNWGEVPSHIQWGNTHGVTIDADSLIYIKHQSSADTPIDAIAVFDPSGKFVRSFGKEYHRGGHGIDIRNEGGEEFLYLSDVHNRQVVKTNLKGEQVWKISYPTEPGVYEKIEQFRPTNIAFAPDGGFYVGDGYGSHYIHQYDKNAKWIRTWGGEGTEPGKMRTPHGMWLDDRPGRKPSIVVCDRANARLQYFTLDGEFISFVEGLSFPADCDTQGEVLLVPDLHARVTLFDKDNNVIAQLGYDENWTKKVLADNLKLRNHADQFEPGRFIHPHDACFDREGNIFVTEWVPMGRVTLLKRVT
jgi:hypothetical protein